MTFLMILGLAIIYSIVHSYIILFKYSFDDATLYERIIAVIGCIMGAILILGNISK